jgi:hypothetical protein
MPCHCYLLSYSLPALDPACLLLSQSLTCPRVLTHSLLSCRVASECSKPASQRTSRMRSLRQPRTSNGWLAAWLTALSICSPLPGVRWGSWLGLERGEGGRGESAGSRQCVHAYGVITGVLGSCAPGEGMVSTGTPRETASHMVSLPLEQMTPVHFEKSS